MNIEQYNKLKQYESYLNTAYKANYVRNMSSSNARELLSIYRELGYNDTINTNCSTCVFRMCKRLGELYFNYVATSPDSPADADLADSVINSKPDSVITEKQITEKPVTNKKSSVSANKSKTSKTTKKTSKASQK